MKLRRRVLKARFPGPIILTTGVLLGVIAAYLCGWFKTADFFLYDNHLRWRHVRPSSESIVLVLMDEPSALELERTRGDWSRKHLAQALENLHRAGAEIVGLDMVLSSPDRDPRLDRLLADAIERSNNVILARISAAEGVSEVAPLSLFQQGMIGDGFIDLPPDNDEILRKIRFFNAKPQTDGNIQLLPAFALELARAYRNIDFVVDFSDPRFFTLGESPGPTLQLPYPELLINYSGTYHTFPTLSFADVVNNRFPSRSVAGKIVIVGSTLATEKDYFTTPITRFDNSLKQYQDTFAGLVGNVLSQKDPGVACHAQAVETILQQNFIGTAATTTVVMLIGLSSLIGLIFYFPGTGLPKMLTALALGEFAAIAGSHVAFAENLLWIEMVPVSAAFGFQFIAGTLLQLITFRRKTAKITQLFGKYVSPAIVAELIREDQDLSLDGRHEEVTILFSDLRNFTGLSERLGPQGTARLLNTYFDRMIPLVFNHEGTLDKLIGDAIMAFFGAPTKVADHPGKAAQTALAMRKQLELLKKTQDISGVQELALGIGLHTGTVTVGNLGSHKFMDYTIIGDAVNLASRLEGLNKVYGTDIIVSQVTATALSDRFLLRELDLVRVKGRKEPVRIYELMDAGEESTKQHQALATLFTRGLAAYRQGDWFAAEEAFNEGLELVPLDPPCRLYLHRLEQIKTGNLLPEGEGICSMEYK